MRRDDDFVKLRAAPEVASHPRDTGAEIFRPS